MIVIRRYTSMFLSLLAVLVILSACAAGPKTEAVKAEPMAEGITELIAKYANLVDEPDAQVMDEIYADDAGYYMDYIMGAQEVPGGEGSKRLIGEWLWTVSESVENYKILSQEISVEGDTASVKLQASLYAHPMATDLLADVTLELVRKESGWLIQDEKVICKQAE